MQNFANEIVIEIGIIATNYTFNITKFYNDFLIIQ